MGTEIGPLLLREEVELERFSGKIIAVDGHNTLYQFLSIIRGPDGHPLTNKEGRITSHLSGLFYRICNLLTFNIKPLFVFDGPPPKFKQKEIEARRERRQEFYEKYEEALQSGNLEEARKYAQGALSVDEYILSSAKRLITLLGLPVIEAPSEGEAQAAYLNKIGLTYAVASQDYDSALFGASLIARNLAISGRRKLPGKKAYVEVKPELVDVVKSLSELGITLEQLVMVGILVGTDFYEGVKGIGPKKALSLVKTHSSLREIFNELKVPFPDYLDEVYDFFLNPPVKHIETINFSPPDKEKIISFLVEENNFNEERVSNALQPVIDSLSKRKTGLGRFMQ
ncbi:MAG: flap endonuclease-1 [Thermoproteota archaeon]|jgi:flap endonuclease-1